MLTFEKLKEYYIIKKYYRPMLDYLKIKSINEYWSSFFKK